MSRRARGAAGSGWAFSAAGVALMALGILLEPARVRACACEAPAPSPGAAARDGGSRTVDRIEGDVVVLEEHGRERRVPRGLLPAVAEGTVLDEALRAAPEEEARRRARLADLRTRLGRLPEVAPW